MKRILLFELTNNDNYTLHLNAIFSVFRGFNCIGVFVAWRYI